MDHFRVDRNRSLTCACCDNETEHEYDVVADQKELINVHILPARPINAEREYADRSCIRSSSTQRLSSDTTGNLFPGYPPRQPPHTAGPAINRDLKPKRQKIKRVKNPPPLPDNQPPYRCVPSPPAFVSDLAQHLSELTLPNPNSGDAQLRKCETADAGSHNGPHTSSVSNGVANQRHSLDLETHDFIKRTQHLERVPSRRHHHEWPQTKEDIDQHDFIPMERPQTYCEEDWYVGTCSRTDAEHALHLVNKDGAFLVRDCSINTTSEPLVLVLYYEKKVYNVKIRYMESTYKYALGTGQRSNDMFDSVADIIKFHSIFPITLISGRNVPVSRYPENCVLTCPITKMDVDRLLQ